MRYKQGETKDFITGFDNSDFYGELLSGQGSAWRPLLAERASFQINPWRPFKEIGLKFNMQNINSRIDLTAAYQPTIEQQTKALFIPEIEEYRDWDIIEDGEYVLLQRKRNPEFPSADQFVNNLPTEKEVSTFEADLGKQINLGANEEVKMRDIGQSFRGTVSLGIQVGARNTTIKATVKKYDLNESTGPDRLTVYVSDDDHRVIFAKTIEDDGDESASGEKHESQTLSIDLTGLEPGEYEVELAANEEVIIQSISSFNQLVYLKKRVRPLGGPDDPAKLHARGQLIKAINKSTNRQRLKVNGQEHIVEPLATLRLLNEKDESEVMVYSSSVIIRTDQGFSLDDFVYYPKPYGYPIVNRSEADNLGINYIYARYLMPVKMTDNRFQLRANYETNDLLLADRGYRFLFEREGSVENNLLIGDISVRFSKEPLTFKTAVTTLRRWLRPLIK